jgi:tRNA U34 5-methylaminomethyl-2-thiouridine-forming methyltransferase MnmC
LKNGKESITSFVREGIFDVIYFDAFDPQAQPELWTEEVMNRMYRSLRTGGVLVTSLRSGTVQKKSAQRRLLHRTTSRTTRQARNDKSH